MKAAFAILLSLAIAPIQSNAFSLLGPYTDWMDETKGYRQSDDIGGPMNFGEGYRWNIPLVTYGFERSFLDYFGSNGVAAVESAFELLNRIPPAAQMDLESFPWEVWRLNHGAEAQGLVDLGSQVLVLLLEQLGLAEPERYTFCVRDFQLFGGEYLFYVVRRNFDPATAQPSSYVNQTLFSYAIVQPTPTPSPTNLFCDAVEFPVDPLAIADTTAAGRVPGVGLYLTNLSRDDAGGLRHLISGNQVRYENLLSDIHPVEGANHELVRGASRPGIEKLTFLRHPTGSLSGEFQPFTNRWTDVYYAGNHPAYQQVERVTTRPDIVFAAQDLGVHRAYRRTDSGNWLNHAELNGNPGGAGPGVIQPPVNITLNNAGPFYINRTPIFMDEATSYSVQTWGSFDSSTNQVIQYPSIQIPIPSTSVHLRLLMAGQTNELQWSLSGPANGLFQFQTSTNLHDWTTLTTLTNAGVIFDFEFQVFPSESSRFFRAIAEP